MIEPAPPSIVWEKLFDAVQTRSIFPDSKTFADAIPRRRPQEILAAYRSVRSDSDESLRDFVLCNFALPSGASTPLQTTRSAGSNISMREHIRELWPALTRRPTAAQTGGSLLPLDGPHVVPGGRFRELYYWDSYFTMLGLRADHLDQLLDTMVDGFCGLLENHGRIPNGTRTYYLSRSQPPVFYLMCGLSQTRDRSIRQRRLTAMVREHAFWMRGSRDASATVVAAERVVPMPDGSVLNRYWDDRTTPRDEAFREDVAIASRSVRKSEDVYRDLRAGAESGWDYSSRWFGEDGTRHSIRTTAIVPVDLNSFLYGLERTIAECSDELGDADQASQYYRMAQTRRAAMARFLWDHSAGLFTDFDWQISRLSPSPTAACLAPLFVGLATDVQAAATAATTEAVLMARGGLRTTIIESGEQWDYPNGWAPLQWIAVQGLRRYGHYGLARTIASRWLATAQAEYARTGRMLEKYDVESSLPGGGGEYPTQEGFGWTNGVTAALIDHYGVVSAEKRVFGTPPKATTGFQPTNAIGHASPST